MQSSFDLLETNPTLLDELTRRGVAEKKARELLTHVKPGQEVLEQLEYVDSLVAKDTRGKLENPPGLYVFYIRDNISPPAGFWSSRKAKLHEEAQQGRDIDRARHARLELEYEEYRDAEIRRCSQALPADEYRQMFDERRRVNRSVLKSMSDEQMDDLTQMSIGCDLENSGRIKLLPFEDFVKAKSQVSKPDEPSAPANGAGDSNQD